MTVQKNIVRFWVLFLAVLAPALGAITVVHRWYRIFPSDEVSEYYTRYAGREGMDVSYVKGYRVNDTIRLDVTVLEVHDSALWEQVCEDCHLLTTAQIPKEYLDFYLAPEGFESYVRKDTVMENDKPREVLTFFVYTRYNKTVCIFHDITWEQHDAIMDSEVDKLD